jgi:hypothetical protein
MTPKEFDEFIPYEQALQLKQLGFNEPCIYYVNKNNEEFIYNFEIHPDEFIYRCGGDIIKTPLYQQAFRWFREKHKLQAEILWRGDMECFCYKTGKFQYGSHDFSKNDYKTYEEAELACLIKLIEIVKI